MTTALWPTISHQDVAAPAPRTWAFAVWRALICCLLFSIIFLPEFVRDGVSEPSLPYAKVAGGFRFIDLAILFVVFGHVVALGCLRTKVMRFPRSLVLPGLAFLGCIGVAICYGRSRGGSNFFFDWRGLALGIGLYFVWSLCLRNSRDVAAAIRVFAVYMAARIALLYVLYLAGYRDTLAGVPIPIFDGPVLSCTVFTGLLAFRYSESSRGASRLLWSCLAAAAYMFVLLCFRRTYWGELAVGTCILLLLQKRNRIRNVVLLVGMVALAAVILGASFSSRIQSIDVTRGDGEFSADNANHVYDLMDAWYQVRQSPLMGIGVGTSYSTWHIRNWKTESVMVHNAPLHVWLKYGITGLICYLWFHIALLRWLYRRSQAATSRDTAFLGAAFAYLAAQFAMTLGFAPWPYSELQLTTLISFILAAAATADQHQLFRSGIQNSSAVRCSGRAGLQAGVKGTFTEKSSAAEVVDLSG
jgi:O-antigen ligase